VNLGDHVLLSEKHDSLYHKHCTYPGCPNCIRLSKTYENINNISLSGHSVKRKLCFKQVVYDLLMPEKEWMKNEDFYSPSEGIHLQAS
jgi:hypothetical protein